MFVYIVVTSIQAHPSDITKAVTDVVLRVLTSVQSVMFCGKGTEKKCMTQQLANVVQRADQAKISRLSD